MEEDKNTIIEVLEDVTNCLFILADALDKHEMGTYAKHVRDLELKLEILM